MDNKCDLTIDDVRNWDGKQDMKTATRQNK